jgi:ankyrin repeat protein
MALLWAATKGHRDVVDLLLEKGAKIEATYNVIKIDKNSCDIRVNINLNYNSNLFV